MSRSMTVYELLGEFFREGAQRLLSLAVDAEVKDWMDAHESLRDEQGHRWVVRNGYMPKRIVRTAVGALEITQARVLDRRCPRNGVNSDSRFFRFRSRLLPPYLRCTSGGESNSLRRYLDACCTGEVSDALHALVGHSIVNDLSSSAMAFLHGAWASEVTALAFRSLDGALITFVSAFGMGSSHSPAEPMDVIVLVGATVGGEAALLGIGRGWRDSEPSWLELLTDCKNRGLRLDVAPVIGDAPVAFLAALGRVFPFSARNYRRLEGSELFRSQPMKSRSDPRPALPVDCHGVERALEFLHTGLERGRVE